MHRGKPCFEWTPGVEIEDVYEQEQEQVLTIENEVEQIVDQEEVHDMIEYPIIGEENEDQLEQPNPDIQDNEEGVIVVAEDNIISEEESFVENEEDEDLNGSVDTQEEPNAEEVVVASIDDHEPEQPTTHSRPRRTNAGAGVNRIQMDFTGKGYGAQREFHFVTNGKTKTINREEMSQRTFMQMATDIIFTQMSANKGFKKYGQPAIAAIIKEFTQLNNGAVPGKPVVRPVNVSTLTPQEKHKALPAVNLIKEKFGGALKGRTCADGSGQRLFETR